MQCVKNGQVTHLAMPNKISNQSKKAALYDTTLKPTLFDLKAPNNLVSEFVQQKRKYKNTAQTPKICLRSAYWNSAHFRFRSRDKLRRNEASFGSRFNYKCLLAPCLGSLHRECLCRIAVHYIFNRKVFEIGPKPIGRQENETPPTVLTWAARDSEGQI